MPQRRAKDAPNPFVADEEAIVAVSDGRPHRPPRLRFAPTSTDSSVNAEQAMNLFHLSLKTQLQSFVYLETKWG